MKHNTLREPTSLDKMFTRAGIDIEYVQMLLAASEMFGKPTGSIEEARKHLRKIAQQRSEEHILQRIKEFQRIKECQKMQEQHTNKCLKQ